LTNSCLSILFYRILHPETTSGRQRINGSAKKSSPNFATRLGKFLVSFSLEYTIPASSAGQAPHQVWGRFSKKSFRLYPCHKDSNPSHVLNFESLLQARPRECILVLYSCNLFISSSISCIFPFIFSETVSQV